MDQEQSEKKGLFHLSRHYISSVPDLGILWMLPNNYYHVEGLPIPKLSMNQSQNTQLSESKLLRLFPSFSLATEDAFYFFTLQLSFSRKEGLFLNMVAVIYHFYFPCGQCKAWKYNILENNCVLQYTSFPFIYV